MSISVSQSFKRTSANAIDETLTLTKAEMLAVNDNLMPSKYLTVCQEDGAIYLYDKSATPNQTTGKFTKFEGGSQVDTSKLYSTDDTASTDIADADYFPFYDTSASGKKKSLWSNVKSVLKTYFDTLYQKTLTAGTNITISGTTINSVGSTDLTFSTTERAVGKWIDNSTVYQKTLDFGYLPNATGKYIAHGISGTFTIISIDAIIYRPSDATTQVPICFFQISNSTHTPDTFANVFRDSNGINVRTSTDVSSFKAYITIRYIKKQLT